MQKIHSTLTLGLVSTLLVAADGRLAAQEATDGAPEGWAVRLDRGGHGGGSDVRFVDMPPGWHVTTGPACILYDPSVTADGEYRVEMEVFLFDPGDRREGYGLIFGGAGLDGPEQSYTYFLIRRDGRFLIKQRQGSETSTLRGWEEHPAVVAWESRLEAEDSTKNVLAVEVSGETVSFRVNGQEVASLPADEISTDGVVGLRVNHSLDLHVSKLEVSERGESDAE